MNVDDLLSSTILCIQYTHIYYYSFNRGFNKLYTYDEHRISGSGNNHNYRYIII